MHGHLERYLKLVRFGRRLVVVLVIGVTVFCVHYFLQDDRFVATPTRPLLKKKIAIQSEAEQLRYYVKGKETHFVIEGDHASAQSERHVHLKGPVVIKTDKGFLFETENADLDLSSKQVKGGCPLSGSGPLGRLWAEKFSIEKGGEKITLEGHASLDIFS